MHIEVKTDNHIQNDERLIEYTRDALKKALDRFQDRVTRVEAHFADENGPLKEGPADIRCSLEARLSGLDPAGVTHHAPSVREALSGAAEKLEKVLAGVVEKERERRVKKT